MNEEPSGGEKAVVGMVALLYAFFGLFITFILMTFALGLVISVL